MKFLTFASVAMLFATVLSAAEVPLTIDKNRSHIEALGISRQGNFTAKLTVFDAVISLDPVEKRIGSAQLTFHFADIKTGDEKRDAEMCTWQQTDQFPDCVYILEALLPAVGGTFNARGKFILHGVTRVITIPITIGYTTPDTCQIDGDLPLDTTDFGLPPLRKYGIFRVIPRLQVKFHLEGRVSPPRPFVTRCSCSFMPGHRG